MTRRSLITGGSSGVGKAVVERFVDAGDRVAILDIDGDAADAVAAAQRARGGECFALRADISSRESVAAAMRVVDEKLGGLDVCANVAAIYREADFESIDDAEWDLVVDVVLKGTFIVTQAATPLLRKAGGGVIVTVTSISSFGSAIAPHYAAAKAGVLGLTKSLALHLAKDGIRVNAVCPGPIRTGIFGKDERLQEKEAKSAARFPPGRMSDPDEIAAVIAFVASSDSSFMTGAHVVADGGFTLGGAS